MNFGKRTRIDANFPSTSNSPIIDQVTTLINDLDKWSSQTNAITALLEHQDATEIVKAAFAGLVNVINSCKTVLGTIKDDNSAAEQERQRSLVLIGLEEPKDDRPSARLEKDRQLITQLFDQLGIEAGFTHYRMGRPSNKPRLIKIILPARHFQWASLGAWKRGRDNIRKMEGWSRLLLRPSLTKMQLEEERSKRTAHRLAMLSKQMNKNYDMDDAEDSTNGSKN